MAQALFKLSQYDKLSLETTGAEVVGNKVVSVKTTTSLRYEPFNNLVQLETMTWENDLLSSRFAADGTTFWNFNAKSNTFSSFAYATEDGLKTDWKQRLFQSYKLRATGISGFAFRIIDEVYGAGIKGGKWLPWMPTATLSRVNNTIICESDTPSPNETVYFLDGNDEEGYSLAGITFKQFDNAHNKVLKRWALTLTPGSLLQDTDFGFIPPKGAKAIALEQRPGG